MCCASCWNISLGNFEWMHGNGSHSSRLFRRSLAKFYFLKERFCLNKWMLERRSKCNANRLIAYEHPSSLVGFSALLFSSCHYIIILVVPYHPPASYMKSIMWHHRPIIAHMIQWCSEYSDYSWKTTCISNIADKNQ